MSQGQIIHLLTLSPSEAQSPASFMNVLPSLLFSRCGSPILDIYPFPLTAFPPKVLYFWIRSRVHTSLQLILWLAFPFATPPSIFLFRTPLDVGRTVELSRLLLSCPFSLPRFFSADYPFFATVVSFFSFFQPPSFREVLLPSPSFSFDRMRSRPLRLAL